MTLYGFVPMCTWIFQVTKFRWLVRYMEKPLCGMLTLFFFRLHFSFVRSHRSQLRDVTGAVIGSLLLFKM